MARGAFRKRASLSIRASEIFLYLLVFTFVLYIASYVIAHKRFRIVFGFRHSLNWTSTASATWSILSKYRLWVANRLVSFQTRSMGFNSGL